MIEPQATMDHQHEWKSELVHSEAEHEFQIQKLIGRRDQIEKLSQIEIRKGLPQLEAYVGDFQYNERGSDRRRTSRNGRGT